MEVAAASIRRDGSHCQNAADRSPWRMAAQISRDLPRHGAPGRKLDRGAEFFQCALCYGSEGGCSAK